MGVHVVAVYRPKGDSDAALLHEVQEHVPLLRRLGLATDQRSTVLRAADGTLIEHFEWLSKETMDAAHEQPEVLAMWGRFSECCDYGTLGDVPEAHVLFAEFEFVGTF